MEIGKLLGPTEKFLDYKLIEGPEPRARHYYPLLRTFSHPFTISPHSLPPSLLSLSLSLGNSGCRVTKSLLLISPHSFLADKFWCSAQDFNFGGFLERLSPLHLLAMGVCLSARVKAESPAHTGLNSQYVTSDSNNMSSDCSKKSSTSVPPTPRTEGEILQSPNLKSFVFSDLKVATRNFRPDSVLGGGGFGSVFKGWIDENSFAAAKPGTGMVIAVKKLHQESYQGHREWLAEVNYLGQFSHPNLVRLIGYCLEDDYRLLVYEFMPRGSLENHLFRRGSYFQPLSWNLRLKVALGAAKGLAFLHSSEAKVIYRDFKTSNILLDSSYNAKLSDFGLAKDGPTGDKSHVSTRVMGTYGYAAPEYLATGHLTAKSDVYSYGVVLLEMLSGRRAIDKNRPSGEHKLVEWSRPLLANKRKVFRVIDNRLDGQYSMDVAQKLANLALRCISLEPKLRPGMEEVVKELEQLQDPKGGAENRGRSGSRQRRRSGGDVGSKALHAAYPRPSASPLHSK